MYFYWSIDFQLKGPLTFRCGSNKKYEHHKLFLFVLNHRDTDGLSIYNGAEGVSIPFYFSPAIYRIHKRLFLQINQSIRMLFCKKKYFQKTKYIWILGTAVIILAILTCIFLKELENMKVQLRFVLGATFP